MIIALPATHHDHLADALVRDLGFKRRHVDAPLREFLLALDPFVDSGVAMANMGPSPRLSSKLEQMGGNDEEGRWTRLLNPPRPGSVPDRVAAEAKRLLDVVRTSWVGYVDHDDVEGDVVVVGVTDGREAPDARFVALQGRHDGYGVTHWIADGGIMGEQEAIVRYVRELRSASTTVKGDWRPDRENCTARLTATDREPIPVVIDEPLGTLVVRADDAAEDLPGLTEDERPDGLAEIAEEAWARGDISDKQFEAGWPTGRSAED